MALPRYYWLMLLLGLFVPTAVTWIYFVALHGTPAAIQQSAYGVLKAAQFVLPILAVGWLAKRELGTVRWSGVGWGWGIGFGLLVALAIVVVHSLLLAGTALGELLHTMIVEKITSMGLATPFRFLAVSVFYAVVHSGLEEYYWRWFVYRWLRQRLPIIWANVVSSLGFGLHHILLLGFFLGFGHWETWVLSGAVSIGGMFWAWLYQKSSDAMGPIWLSHALVDAGIFGLGFWLIRSELGLN